MSKRKSQLHLRIKPKSTAGKLNFHVYQDSAGDYRWRLQAANGKVIADSGEGYKNQGDAFSAIVLVMSADIDTTVVVK